MVKRITNQNLDFNCSQCGSKLIFVSEETVKPDGARYPQKNTVYRCSNDECQEKKDKEKADRVKQSQKKAEIAQTRLEEMQEKKRVAQRAATAGD